MILRALVSPLRSLQAKLLLGTLGVLVLVMGGVMVVVERGQRQAIIDEMERRSEVLARSLAAVSTSPLVLYSFTELEQHVARVATEADVVYALVLDLDGRVAAHSKQPALAGTFLPDPVDRRAAGATALTIQPVPSRDGEAPLYDVAYPIMVEGRKWGTARVGVSRGRMEALIRDTRRQLYGLGAATILLGGVLASLVARRIARPVKALAGGAEAIARGDLHQRIVPAGHDEIGQLAIAFNHMATQLGEHRRQLETAHGRLREQYVELGELKSYTDSIMGSLTTGVITLDLDGRITTVNTAGELLLGVFAREAIGRFCTEALARAPGVAEALMETLASRGGHEGLSLTLVRPGGQALAIEMSTAPLRGAEGKELGVVGVLRDVSRVRELEDQLRRSDRLASLGTLAAGLAHEIKNPLTSLRTFIGLMPRKIGEERFRESLLRVVPGELDRINGIVDHLLQLARPSTLRLQPVLVSTLLDRALDLHAQELELHGIEIVRQYDSACPAVQADPDELYKVLVNLVRNALEAMEQGGELTARIGWAGVGEAPTSGRRGPSWRGVRIEIADTGPGISAEAAERVFTPFFTTKAGGTGLGLALTHKIIEEHGGAVRFVSPASGGATFRIVLPIGHDRAGLTVERA